ncbi:hypothetical protein ACTFIZ_000196 [Dictyostelium cf. discoideum]
MPKSKHIEWLSSEDELIKSSQSKKPPTNPKDLLKQLNEQFKKKRTLNQLVNRMKILSDNSADHTITVNVPQQIKDSKDVSESESEYEESENETDDNFSLYSAEALSRKRKQTSNSTSNTTPKKQTTSLAPGDLQLTRPYVEQTEHYHNVYEFFNTHKMVLSPPMIFPLENNCFKLIFSRPPFGIKIMNEMAIVKDIHLGIKYHILLPTRDQISVLFGSDVANKWSIKNNCLPLKTTLFQFMHFSAPDNEKLLYTNANIKHSIDIFGNIDVLIQPKEIKKVDEGDWIEN